MDILSIATFAIVASNWIEKMYDSKTHKKETLISYKQFVEFYGQNISVNNINGEWVVSSVSIDGAPVTGTYADEYTAYKLASELAKCQYQRSMSEMSANLILKNIKG